MKKRIILTSAILSLLSACGGGGGSTTESTKPTDNEPVQIEHLGGGDATVNDVTVDAFSEHSENMDDVDRIQKFNLGNDFFQNPWVAGSASTSSRDGLGGVFNNNACQDCHIRDGRGHAPNISATEDGSDFSSILFRAARANISSEDESLMLQSLQANVPDSSVGGQLQQDSIANVTAEASLGVSYQTSHVEFEDGFSVELRKPVWELTSNYAEQGYDFDIDTVFSARVAPQMIGLGLLALIPEVDLLQNEDIEDSNNDGISGKANVVWSVANQNVTIGRFGWKAGQPSLVEQSAGAFVNDMGLTNQLHQQGNCMPHQADCLSTENGNGDSVADYDYEVSDKILAAIGFYSAHLAVPERRDAYSDQVQRGKTLFNDAGCTGCHTAQHTTEFSVDHPELSEQTIFPYTDMLLHDMGQSLADFDINNTPAAETVLVEFLANAHEWRTPPLWGLGLVKTVDPEATFLHDGRARTIMEAVLWHGGEAETAKQNVLLFDTNQRADFLAFLNDL